MESLNKEVNDCKTKGISKPIPLSTLPSFSLDYRFYIWGGVLTRDEWESALFVDTLFLGKKLYVGSGEHGVSELGDKWQMGKLGAVNNLAEVRSKSCGEKRPKNARPSIISKYDSPCFSHLSLIFTTSGCLAACAW